MFFTAFAIDNTTVPVIRRCISKIPPIETEMKFQKNIQQFLTKAHNPLARTTANYTLPVIVHIVYWDDNQNISQNQVYSQFDVLNADFSGTGYNVNNLPAAFQPALANTNISFCKAIKAPNGATLPEPGIDRVSANQAGFKNPGTNGWADTYIDATIKPATTWDASKYLNIWVLPLKTTDLGYATFPGGTKNIDGVVIGYNYFGTTGTVSSPYDRGRTTSHEIGHWLNLRHISGDAVCGDDFCADTPPQKGNSNDGSGLNYGCPNYPFQVNGCGAGKSPNGEMFMNFMDYTDDACMSLFTNDQRTRMQTAMATDPLRMALANSNVCSLAPLKPVADFVANKTSVCPGTQISFTDLSLNNPTSLMWTFAGGSPSSSTALSPTVIYNNPGTYTVTLRATNAAGFDDKVKTAYITVTSTGASLPFTEGFQGSFPPSGWSLVSTSGYNWQLSTLAGGFGTSSQSVYFDNYDNNGNGNKDDIISPLINLSGATNPQIKFDVAYARYSSFSNDTLEVLIADACNANFVSIYKKGGSNLATTNAFISNSFTPSSTQWVKDSIVIPAGFLNKSVKIAFRNNGAFGNNIYIDNINVYNKTAIIPVATANFTASATSVCIGNSLLFTNTSTATVGTPDSVRWTIQGSSPTTSTSTTTINPVFNTVGNFTVSLVAFKAGNASAPFVKTITVNAKPIVKVTSPIICAGQTAQPVASGAQSYTWTNGLSPLYNPITPQLYTPTTYTVTGTDINNCSATALSTVSVTPIPATPTIMVSNDTLYCTAISGAIYDWYKGGVLISSSSNPFVKSTGMGTYTVKITNNNCSSAMSAGFLITGVKYKKLTIDMSIHPNPNTGSFEINIGSAKNNMYQLKLFNVNGQILLEENITVKNGANTFPINLNGVEKGVYFLNISGEEGSITQNIVVQ